MLQSQGKYKKSEETISRILKATRQLLNEKGFSNVTVRDICAAANVSAGSFYSHFKGKEQLLATIYTNAATGRKELPSDVLSDGSCKIRLTNFVKHYAWVNMSNGPEALKVILSCSNPIYTINRHWGDYVFDIVSFGLKNGEIVSDLSAEVLTDMLMTCLRGCAHEWCRSNGNYDLDSQMVLCASLLFSSLWHSPCP